MNPGRIQKIKTPGMNLMNDRTGLLTTSIRRYNNNEVTKRYRGRFSINSIWFFEIIEFPSRN